jgi:Pvc16 N-terminal domain/Carboxypeptidase regulatory-like domain
MVIRDLDRTLLRLFRNAIADLASDTQVRFEPPTSDWRDYVNGLGSPGGAPMLALNVYLTELREDRKLRVNDPFRVDDGPRTYDEPAPARVECTYLVSAWDPAKHSQAVQPTPAEHALLYEALAVLFANVPLNPSRVLAGPELAAVDERIRDAELPVRVAPPEGFPKTAEFWSAMGPGIPWRPVVPVVITIPVSLPRTLAAPIVTTTITDHTLAGVDAAGERWARIGGAVLDATVAPAVPLPGAWVALETAAGALVETTRANASGRFVFSAVRPGPYRLRWRAGGRPEPAPRLLDIPSPTGEYDLRFEP